MESKSTLIKLKFIELLSLTSAHGLPRLLKTKHLFLKLIWILCWLTSAIYCSYFAFNAVFAFLNYKVFSTIIVKREIFSQFPTVSICNPDMPLDNVTILKCNLNTNNNSLKLIKFIDPYYGTCLRFNGKTNDSNTILTTTYTGTKYGLQLDLIIDSIYDFNEIILYIHNYSLITSTILNHGYRISSGSIYYFKVERVFSKKLEEPYNNCFKDVQNFNGNKTLINHITYDLASEYSYQDCFRLCRNLFVLEESNCSCMVTLDNAASCSKHPNQTVRNCYNNYVAKFQVDNSMNEKCFLNYCPLECDSLEYNIIQTIEPLPSFGQVKNTNGFAYASNFADFSQVKRSFFSIFVYYEDLKYTEINESPSMETFSLVSIIGGTFGLFLGISFLSFLEIFELIYELIYICFFDNRSQKIND